MISGEFSDKGELIFEIGLIAADAGWRSPILVIG
jgi:hypothetical protein